MCVVNTPSTPYTHRMPRNGDSSTVISLDTDGRAASTVVPLSQTKLDQLARARARSLEVRRRKAKDKMEAKLQHLRYVLGSDMRPDTVERFAKEMMAQESRLREKHGGLLENLKEAIHGFREELRSLRKLVDKSGGRTGAAASKQGGGTRPPASAVSSSPSVASLSVASSSRRS